MSAPKHISVCVCTFKRPHMLAKVLDSLQHQRTNGLFTYSIVVADNDASRSGEPVVAACQERGPIRIDYYAEPNRNIALARNKAVANAHGDFVAFIDDDEFAVEDWLLHLFNTSVTYNADAVLGPVVAAYESTPPDWVVKGELLERPRCVTGTVLPWYNTRTGNTLLSRAVFDGGRTLFRAEFRHSEDQDFFKRIIAKGRVVVWCDEAVAYETQGTDRFKLAYFLKRALLRGNVSLRLRSNSALTIAKSAVASWLYTVALLPLALVRRDLAIVYMIKDCDHIGKLLAACRIDVQKYLT
jgi:glycosyltransferase involved in cell wall biosynthesis